MKKILCIGDSITYGYLLSNRQSYPYVLEKLAFDFEVMNSSDVGLSAYDYHHSSLFIQGKRWNPDIVVIMFGSNDSSPMVYRSTDFFLSYYKDLITEYSCKVVLCTPCFAYSTNYGVSPKNLKSIVDCIRELNYPVVDIYQISSKHPEWFEVDGIHPNSIGAKEIANQIYKEIIK